MTTKQNVCYYGLHIGCLNATSPDCRTCAEHLTHAVTYVAREATTLRVGTHNDGAHHTLTLPGDVPSAPSNGG